MIVLIGTTFKAGLIFFSAFSGFFYIFPCLHNSGQILQTIQNVKVWHYLIKFVFLEIDPFLFERTIWGTKNDILCSYITKLCLCRYSAKDCPSSESCRVFLWSVSIGRKCGFRAHQVLRNKARYKSLHKYKLLTILLAHTPSFILKRMRNLVDKEEKMDGFTMSFQ